MEFSIVQLILATDGDASFAIFHIEDPELWNNDVPEDVVGFSPGVGNNTMSSTSFRDIEDFAVFRIDGIFFSILVIY